MDILELIPVGSLYRLGELFCSQWKVSLKEMVVICQVSLKL